MSAKTIWLSFVLLLAAASPPMLLPARGQIVLTLSKPVTDSFPIIDIDVSVTENGAPAALVSGTNFSVREDGIPGNVLSLKGCGGTSSAAIALVIDTSASMDASIGSGPATNRTYAMFNDAISNFVASIPGPSLLALVPFADTSKYWYPGPLKNNFYYSTNTTDTTTLAYRIAAFRYVGTNTDVVSGIVEGAAALAKSTLPRRIMVLITDAAITNADSIQLFLNSLGITLYVMEVDRDSTRVNYVNHDLAIATGGAYFAAYDTTLYTKCMLEISQLIFSEHCILEYRSLIPCPEWKTHLVEVTLNYKNSLQKAYVSYTMGHIRHDSLAPRMSLDTPRFTLRMVHAYDFFPCESGVRTLLDSSSLNFTVHPREFTQDSVSDSLAVIDSLYPADAYILAIDSAGNIGRMHIHYQPKPDTHPPQLSTPLRTGPAYTDDIREMLPWDRGIDTVFLAPSAKNLSLDSVRFESKQLAHAFLHLLDRGDAARGCMVAIDSVGNRDSVCIEWGGETADTLPPLFVQNPIAEPRTALSGIVTEERRHDHGLRQVILTPLSNTSSPSIIFDSVPEARVSVALVDSLYPARALVEAFDSAGNYMRDTMRYEPLPDIIAPICTYTTPTRSTFIFTATDTQAWDRGIAFVLLLPSSVNATCGAAIFSDGHRAALTVTVTDRTLNATIAVQVTDSAGHQTTVTINFAGIPLIPIGDSVIDFGTVIAPAGVTRSVLLTNQNDIPVVLDIGSLQGDDSVFKVVTSNPMLFPAFGTEVVSFEFHPSLIGTYSATATIEHHVGVGSVRLLGRSIGSVQLALDTVTIRGGQAGEMHLSIDVQPKPSNLDTIGFTITYDPDMLTFGDLPSCPNGSLDTGLCLYDASWSVTTEGNRQAMLVRHNANLGSTLSFDHTVLTLPFQTFVSMHDTTRVHLQPLHTYSAKTLSAHDGLVLAADTCGSPTLRGFLTSGHLSLTILSAAPNPAQSSVTLTVESGMPSDAEVRMVSMSGALQQSFAIHLSPGEQKIVLPDLPQASGTYEIVIRVGGVDIARRPIEVVR